MMYQDAKTIYDGRRKGAMFRVWRKYVRMTHDAERDEFVFSYTRVGATNPPVEMARLGRGNVITVTGESPWGNDTTWNNRLTALFYPSDPSQPRRFTPWVYSCASRYRTNKYQVRLGQGNGLRGPVGPGLRVDGGTGKALTWPQDQKCVAKRGPESLVVREYLKEARAVMNVSWRMMDDPYKYAKSWYRKNEYELTDPEAQKGELIQFMLGVAINSAHRAWRYSHLAQQEVDADNQRRVVNLAVRYLRDKLREHYGLYEWININERGERV